MQKRAGRSDKRAAVERGFSSSFFFIGDRGKQHASVLIVAFFDNRCIFQAAKHLGVFDAPIALPENPARVKRRVCFLTFFLGGGGSSFCSSFSNDWMFRWFCRKIWFRWDEIRVCLDGSFDPKLSASVSVATLKLLVRICTFCCREPIGFLTPSMLTTNEYAPGHSLWWIWFNFFAAIPQMLSAGREICC